MVIKWLFNSSNRGLIGYIVISVTLTRVPTNHKKKKINSYTIIIYISYPAFASNAQIYILVVFLLSFSQILEYISYIAEMLQK